MKEVYIYKCFSNKPESKGFCLFEVKTNDKNSAMNEIKNYSINKGLSFNDFHVEKFLVKES